MTDSRIPDLSTVASPPRCSLSYAALEVSDEPIGAGGQAVVYDARLTGNNGQGRVALKEPQQTATLTREAVETFLKEADTWSTIDRRERDKPRWHDSEHIVGVIDTGDDQPWIAMEYMDGGDLQDRLEANPDGLPLDEALWFAEATCRGLELAHNYGIAHLDLKPANVLFRETGPDTWDVPKVADWGVARVLAEQTGAMEGLSVRYAAPEQFEPGEFGDPDKLTDIYQAGALIYASLTGEPPYTGSQTNIMFDVVTDDLPAPPSEHRAGVSETLDAAVLTALEAEKTDRYRDISIFEQALRAIRTDSPLPPIIQRRVSSRSQSRSSSHTESDEGNSPSGGKSFRERGDETRERRSASGKKHAGGTWSLFGGGPRRTGHHPTATGPRHPTTQWSYETGRAVRSSPAVVDGTVYVGSNDGNLYALDATTGDTQWSYETGDWVKSSPAVVDGTVYVGSKDHNLYSVGEANVSS